MPETQGEWLANHEVRIGQLERLTQRVTAVEGRVATFIDRHEAREEEREAAQMLRHRENSEKLTEIGNLVSHRNLLLAYVQAAIGMAALAAMIYYGIMGIKAALHSGITFPEPVTSAPYVAGE